MYVSTVCVSRGLNMIDSLLPFYLRSVWER